MIFHIIHIYKDWFKSVILFSDWNQWLCFPIEVSDHVLHSLLPGLPGHLTTKTKHSVKRMTNFDTKPWWVLLERDWIFVVSLVWRDSHTVDGQHIQTLDNFISRARQISKLFSSSKGWDGWTFRDQTQEHDRSRTRCLAARHVGMGVSVILFPQGLNVLSIYGITSSESNSLISMDKKKHGFNQMITENMSNDLWWF